MTVNFMNYSFKISDFISNISKIFVGEYSYKNNNLNDLRTEILDISDIPSTWNDKKNLKEDFNLLLSDTKKAQNKIKKEIYG